MTTIIQGNELRAIALGVKVEKAYTLAVETKSLFTVSGVVLVTAIVGKVTTAITVANTVKLQVNPTVGTSSDLCAATDLGSTDTPAGDLISISGAPTDAPVVGIGAAGRFPVRKIGSDFLGGVSGVFVGAGTIDQVTATGADGVVTWYLTYVPVEDGASVVAA